MEFIAFGIQIMLMPLNVKKKLVNLLQKQYNQMRNAKIIN
jgi:hypothetical protein